MRWSVQDFRNKSDEELAAIAQSGGEGAEEELLNRYKSAVRARARKFFLTGGETEDLAQEGMIGLVSAIRDFRADGGKSFKNFAYLCVSRRIYSALRAAGRTPEYDDLDPDSVSEGAADWRWCELTKCGVFFGYAGKSCDRYIFCVSGWQDRFGSSETISIPGRTRTFGVGS